MAVNLLIVYARSGGTLFNQCLAALPKTIVISEVCALRRNKEINRYEDVTCIWGQAKQWYGIQLNADYFEAAVLELEEYCMTHEISLIIRDWTYSSFTPCPENSFKPKHQLETYHQLKEKTEIKSFALVRDCIDVWLSRGRPLFKEFENTYGKYVNALLGEGIKTYKYEQLCSEPDKVMSDVCLNLNIQYDPKYKTQYLDSHVLGDVQLGNQSRGKRQGTIKPLRRKFMLPHQIGQLNKNQFIKMCNKRMGYPSHYFNKNHGFFEYLVSAFNLINQKLRT